MKRDIKFKVGLFLLLLTGIGLTITTLHSHHHLEWNHSSDFTDTGHCISSDTTVCPISGYLFETEILSPSSSADAFFNVENKVSETTHFAVPTYLVVDRGRSPPVIL
ncbi:hypothetical protein [Fodinibius sediminis]|uniref:Uncharacterized protein n=1 Tax=Fodinibius sediminis TaxID=1214077 RepID=A0A521D9B8_9BACT|nr:hypothetical protein [Fodinibius sediminis]SMO68317.1 hypothetical protein SAMN06265218_10944 [Fodinibius sediminis]